MHKPLFSLFFTLSVFLFLGLLSAVFPEKPLVLFSGIEVKFPSFAQLLEKDEQKNKVAEIIRSVETIDTTFAIVDSATSPALPPKSGDSVKKLITGIQYRNKDALSSFFVALKDLKSNPGTVRVLHYGDSQIEGDRITDYLRQKLQGQFGGGGPGLISFMPVTQSITNRIVASEGWDKYGAFVAKDRRVRHNNYGVLAGFNRFREYRRIYDTTKMASASVTVTTTKFGGASAMDYKKVKLFYGGSRSSTWCEFYDGPALVTADSLKAGGDFNVKEYNVGQGSFTHSLKFTGKDSPDFYALSLESDNGVLVDNIALRGSSGTFFHLVSIPQLKQFYEHLQVKLIVLQFGGNVLPSIKDATMAANYGDYLRYQISLVKKAAPGASILFIGPSDMSIKEGTSYVTWPMLEPTRDAIKKAVLESGCAFFDMYDSMGGKNSMPAWVDQKLAATDYTHFSPQGARKIATLLYSALVSEYNLFLQARK